MSPIVPTLFLARTDEAHEGFMDQRSRLQRVPRRLLRHAAFGQSPQFVIDQRQQLIGPPLYFVRFVQDSSNFTHARILTDPQALCRMWAKLFLDAGAFSTLNIGVETISRRALAP